jgi:hypothetical protein
MLSFFKSPVSFGSLMLMALFFGVYQGFKESREVEQAHLNNVIPLKELSPNLQDLQRRMDGLEANQQAILDTLNQISSDLKEK